MAAPIPAAATANPYVQYSNNSTGTATIQSTGSVAPLGNLYLLETLLTHADPGDALVDYGQVVGVSSVGLSGIARASAAATTDYVPVEFNRSFKVEYMYIKGEDAAGNSAVAYGDIVYVDSDGELNKDSINGTPVGMYLGATISSGSSASGPVALGFH